MKNPLYSVNLNLSITSGSDETVYIKLEHANGDGYSNFNLQTRSIESFLEQLGNKLKITLNGVIKNLAQNIIQEERLRNNMSEIIKRFNDISVQYKYTTLDSIPVENGKPFVDIYNLHRYSTKLLQTFLKEAKRCKPEGIFHPSAPTIDEVAQKHFHEEQQRFDEVINKIKEELKSREGK